MKPGDLAFLLDYATTDGLIRAVVNVKVYTHIELEGLSKAVWGSLRFPYIFFFDRPTNSTTIRWSDFRKQMGFAENYNPAGRFHVITPDRLARYGGEHGYMDFLRSNKFIA